jgi:hypothetical protein
MFMRLNKDQAFHVGYNKRKHDGPSSSKTPKKTFKKDVPKSKGEEKEIRQSSRQNVCHYSEKEGHSKVDCRYFLKWLMNKSIDEITFVDLYADFSTKSWWIDSGATAHLSKP